MNEQDNRDANNQSKPAESMADLPLTTEHAEDAKAGAGFNVYGNFNGGVRVPAADSN